MKIAYLLLFFLTASIPLGGGQHPGSFLGQRLRIILEVARIDFGSSDQYSNLVVAHVTRGEESGRFQSRMVREKNKVNEEGEILVDHSSPGYMKYFVRTYGKVVFSYSFSDSTIEKSVEYDWSEPGSPRVQPKPYELVSFNIFAEGGYALANFIPDAERGGILDQVALLSEELALDLPEAYSVYREHSEMFSGVRTREKVEFLNGLSKHKIFLLRMLGFRQLLRWDALEDEAISAILNEASGIDFSVYVVVVLENLADDRALDLLLPFADAEIPEDRVEDLILAVGGLFLEEKENRRMHGYIQKYSSFLPREILVKKYRHFSEYEEKLNAMPTYRILRKVADSHESDAYSSWPIHKILSYGQFIDIARVPQTKMVKEYIEKHSPE